MDTNNIKDEVSARTTPNTRLRSRGRWLAILGIPLAVGVLSMSVARAHGFGGPGHGDMAAHMQGRIDHLLTAAGATDAQKAQVKAVWDGTRPQLQPLHKQHADLRRQIGQALAAPTIDAARIEQLRQQSVATMDKISALTTKAMVASAQVLTPDQRKVVLQKIEEHRGHRPGAPE